MRTPACLLAVLLSACLAWAQDVRVGASIERSDEAYVGAPVDLVIRVDGVSAASLVAAPSIPGVRLDDLGWRDASVQHVVEVNGRRHDLSRVACELRLRLTPREPGEITIPEIEIEAGGRRLRTELMTFVAREPESSADSRLELRLDETSPFVGQVVRGSLVWTLSSQIRGYSIGPIAPEGVEVLLPERVEPGPGEQVVRISIDSGEAFATMRQATLAGRAAQEYEIPFYLIVTGGGDAVEIGPVTVTFEQITGERPRGFLDSPFDDRRITRRAATRSGSITLRPRPLPPDAPPGFTGLVGEYAIAAECTPGQVDVGDPISLSVRIAGPEPLRSVRPPDLTALAPFADSFKVSSEGWKGEANPAEARVFSTTVRARRADVTAIPSIELPYFSPALGEYRVARSDPIPIRVRPTRTVTADDALVSPGGPAPPPQGRRLVSASEGVLANLEGDSLLVSHAPTLAWTGSPRGLALLAAPPALAFAAACARLLLSRGQADTGARRRRLVRRARRDLSRARRTPRPSLAAGDALSNLVARWHARDPRSTTSTECVALVRPINSDLADELREVLDRADAARYAPQAAPAHDPFDASAGARAAAWVDAFARSAR